MNIKEKKRKEDKENVHVLCFFRESVKRKKDEKKMNNKEIKKR